MQLHFEKINFLFSRFEKISYLCSCKTKGETHTKIKTKSDYQKDSLKQG